MTTTAPEKTTLKAPVKKTRWRAWRLLTPYLVAVALVILTIVAVSVESPDTGDAEYLSPTATGDFGGSVLAGRLAEQGVEVRTVTDADEAVELAARPGSVLFIPAVDYLRGDQLAELASLPPDTRIVLVKPGQLRLTMLTGLTVAETRLATGLADPGCTLAEAAAAGPAEVFSDRYTTPRPPEGEQKVAIGMPCYGGSLTAIPASEVMPETIVVGAADPFTNGRINAAGNSALAVGLLSAGSHLVWLDLHATEPLPPQETVEQEQEPYEPPPASSPENPLYKAFPSWVWAMLIGLLALFALAAMARGRRLGPPVVEPLPVQVPAAETVYGRARLYRRGASREAALQAMRDGALSRMLPVVGLSSKSDRSQVVSTVAARAGWDDQQVRNVLFGPEPGSDQDLLNSIHALDTLENAVLGERPHERHRR
ncbi:DUF4350 domain-containing protein [Phytomonospora sp. NPDC050363]|uniref:DUF4350 domain-containing protein n=1 Tax=Phytomonospora sp. NPDC050363 TaxID=3155642 RepID=UPI0033E2177E